MEDQVRGTSGKIVEFLSRAAGRGSDPIPSVEDRNELRLFANEILSELNQSLVATRDEFQNQHRIASESSKGLTSLVGRYTAKAPVSAMEPLIGADAERLSELHRRRAPAAGTAPNGLKAGIPGFGTKVAETVRDLEEIASINVRLAAAVRSSSDPASVFAGLGSESPDWDARKLEALTTAMDKAGAFHAGCLHLVRQHAVVDSLLHDFARGLTPLTLDECRTVMTAASQTDDPEMLASIGDSVVRKDVFDRFEASVLHERGISPSF